MTRDHPKTALITGAAKRIGRHLALSLAERGWDIAVHYNSSEADAAEVADEIRKCGRNAAILRADLSRENEVAGLIARAADALGPLTCLVNNASVFEYDSIDSATRSGWDTHLETNLRAPFVLTQEFAKALPADAGGVVVNLIDQRVWNLTPHFVTYTISKAALWTLTQTLALALAPRIRVNAIGPGPTLANTRQTPEQFARQCAAMPLRHGASPQDIADALHYILDAKSMTGQMIALDGGQHLAWCQPAAIVPEE